MKSVFGNWRHFAVMWFAHGVEMADELFDISFYLAPPSRPRNPDIERINSKQGASVLGEFLKGLLSILHSYKTLTKTPPYKENRKSDVEYYINLITSLYPLLSSQQQLL
ncbi:hypothetical protein CDAR_230231 [Caerostris darwini]|uniref:Uncharacterized protein n=1 Tax=Caerostris darwini TaxID=1538125 RepID=A0AAV4MJI2_9ARAC|nr:hypothetical protein CDAR_230231 [Caerostris darwini]